MSDKTAIEWTDVTWNPVTGCTKVSPGCANCYIERTPAFRMTGQRFERGRIPVRLHHDRLDQPLHWRKPRRVFVVSMGDLFHEDVPDEFIWRVFQTMAAAHQHTFQVLTKRADRLRDFGRRAVPGPYPLSNVWLGVSVENQRMADERIPLLLETPAAVRFLSCEPLLGPLDLTPWLEPTCKRCKGSMSTPVDGGGAACPRCVEHQPLDPDHISWVIVGGESGPGRAERKLVERCEAPVGHAHSGCHRNGGGLVACGGWRPKLREAWVIDIRDQCQAAGVPFFFKQWGGPRPTSGGRLLDGREHNEMPEREAVPA